MAGPFDWLFTPEAQANPAYTDPMVGGSLPGWETSPLGEVGTLLGRLGQKIGTSPLGHMFTSATPAGKGDKLPVPPSATGGSLFDPGNISGLVPPLARSTLGGGYGAGTHFGVPSMPPLPPREPLGRPEIAEDPDDFDPSRAREALKGAEPKAPVYGGGYTSDILGGLARGVMGVDPTKPGSFAAALAAAGAGGAGARSEAVRHGEEERYKHEKDVSAWKTTTAKQEMDIAKQEFDAGEARRQADQTHLDRMWQTEVEERRRTDEQTRWEYTQRKPVYQTDGSGITSIDPITGEGKRIDLRHPTEAFQSLAPLLKAMGHSDDMVDTIGLSMLLKDAPGEPPKTGQDRIAITKNFLAERVTSDPARARAIFHSLWDQTRKQISDQLEKSQGPAWAAEMAKDPVKYNATLDQHAGIELRNKLMREGNNGWIYDLAEAGNPIAKKLITDPSIAR